MEVDDFEQYRRLFYFFQYAFAVRGNLLTHDTCDADNKLNIMHELATAPEYFHFRNEHMPHEPISCRRNRPKTDSSPDAPLLPGLPKMDLLEHKQFKKYGTVSPKYRVGRSGTLIYTATAESQYRHLMLNNGEWLKTKNGRPSKDFFNLYRSLLIFDLYQRGETAKGIYDNYGNICIDEVIATIGCNRMSPFKMISDVALQQDLMAAIQGNRIYNSESEQLILDRSETDNISFIGSAEDCENLYIRRIQSHYDRALQLIHLAETGTFKTFPLVIVDLK